MDYDHRLKLRPAGRLLKRELVANGPLQLRLRSTYRLSATSSIRQDMVFHTTTPRIDFETVVGWHETHKLLKAGFDVAVLADNARHEVQFGHVERPTHENRDADKARFEVCNHKWTDLSENRFGVALLNDCKYGIGVRGSEMRLTLLRSGTHPDHTGDRGHHTFTYALLPHAGAFHAESVIRPAYELNVPPVAAPAGPAATAPSSLVTVDASNVIVEAVKWAEADDGVVLRLYEAERSGTYATLALGLPVRRVTETNMLEEQPRPLVVRDGKVRLYFRPFEIKTLHLRRR